ncbi:hypothetical protein BH10BAC4_BH10BAC4_14340 [soil metagenome]
MEINQEIVERLTSLRERKKFTDVDWEKRGLIPSDSDKISEMIQLTDVCLDEILTEVKSNTTERQIRKTLIKGLKRFKNSYYDTEEKEFIGEKFYKIGSILGLDIADNLNDWLYGKVLGTLIGVTKKKEVIIETKSFECSKCKLSLNIKITAAIDGVQNHWIIGLCSQCGEYNLLSTGENAGGTKFENFEFVEMFDSNVKSEDQAKTRLEQIKYFRGRK